ncbi:TerB family tellurite resistance protein [Flavobacteriales bacterium]|nr:TerB family tellurite resistance protein [Flavobacteriales bacterium]
MKKNEFKEMLLQTAVCAIACDGKIDDREKQALYHIEKESTYFVDFNLSKKLESSIKACTDDYNLFQDKLFNSVNNSTLNIVQELMLLEVSLRIIAADNIEEDLEKVFILKLRELLVLSDDMIKERFGVIDYLHSSEFKSFNTIADIESKKIEK